MPNNELQDVASFCRKQQFTCITHCNEDAFPVSADEANEMENADDDMGVVAEPDAGGEGKDKVRKNGKKTSLDRHKAFIEVRTEQTFHSQ